MNREKRMEDCSHQHFDVIIIGGGITGAGIVRDASMRGLKCLLLEKNDFSSGTSSKSGKLIHGGLRYLKNFKVGLVFESLRERSYLLNILSPHLVRKVRFVLPFYSWNHTPRWLAAIGLFIYDIFAASSGMKTFKFLSVKELAILEPGLVKGYKGGLIYYDCACLDTRLTIDTLKSAKNNGSELFNYCEVIKIDFFQDQVEVRAKNQLNGQEITFTSKSIINAAGPWSDEVIEKGPSTKKFDLKATRGIHLVISKERLPIQNTISFEHPDDYRNIYLVPWDNNILVGTTDQFYEGNKDSVPSDASSVQYLLKALNRYFPNSEISSQDIKSTFAGIRPLVGMEAGQSATQVSRDYEILVDKRGMISITGGKLTTYRLMAEKTVDRLIEIFFKNGQLKKCSTISPIIQGNRHKIKNQIENIPLSSTLIDRYGPDAHDMMEKIAINPQKNMVIQENLPYVWAEIDYFIENEFVESLEDIIFRRTSISMFYPSEGLKVISQLANYLGQKKHWDEARMNIEIINIEKKLKVQDENNFYH